MIRPPSLLCSLVTAPDHFSFIQEASVVYVFGGTTTSDFQTPCVRMTGTVVRCIHNWQNPQRRAFLCVLAIGKKGRQRTVEAVQAPHLVLCDLLAPCQGRIQVHYSFWVQGMHESEDMANFVSCHMYEIR